ncbi:MAG: hypothetical protein FJ102_11515 [Deltaproteobacteria bacterium]|nr:hypothetical protein [Deltaproteobacteria bacterium]
MLLLVHFLACEPGVNQTGSTPSESDADTDSDADADADADPDDADDFATAWDLPFDTESGDAIEGDDIDIYKVTGTAGQQFRVQVINSDEGEAEDSLDTVVQVFEANGTRIAWEDEHPAGEVSTYDSVCFGFFPSTAEYYVQVQDRRSYEGSESPVSSTDYTVQILSPGSIPAEDDSLLSVGGSFDIENTYSWYSFPLLFEEEADVDFVSVGLPYDDAAVVLVANEHVESSPAQPYIDVYNQDAEQVFHADPAWLGEGRQMLSTLGTSYVLAVGNSAGGGGEAYGAWIFVLITEEGYGNDRETEPNDEVADDLDMVDQEPSAGSWYAGYAEGRVESTADVDAYALGTGDEAYLSVAFGALSYGSLLVAGLDITDESGTVIATASSVGGDDPQIENAGPFPAGSYTVTVRALDDGSGGTLGGVGEGGAYRLGVHATSVPM